MALGDRRILPALGFLSVALSVGCSPSDTQIAIERAPDFRRANPVVSILGVYKDGRMNTEGWGGIAPELAKAFRGGPCDAAFSESFVFTHAELAAAVDDYARANGPTQDLLAALAPAARGDVVLVVTLAGHAPAREKISLSASEAAKGNHQRRLRRAPARRATGRTRHRRGLLCGARRTADSLRGAGIHGARRRCRAFQVRGAPRRDVA